MTIEQLLEKQEIPYFDVDKDLFLAEANSVDQTELESAIKRMPYDDFLHTYYWVCIARIVKARDGRRCRMCASHDELRTHHSTYVNHGSEHRHMDDLVCICSACHEMFHAGQKNKVKANGQQKQRREIKAVPVASSGYNDPWTPSTKLLSSGGWTICKKTLRRIGISKAQISKISHYDKIRIVESSCNWLPSDLERAVKWKRTGGYGPWRPGQSTTIAANP